MDTRTLLRLYAGCAREEISRLFLPNSCIASTAISLDVLTRYGTLARPWEVCLQVDDHAHHIDLGCSPPSSSSEVGGHLVAIVEEAFLLDASLGQLSDRYPSLDLPAVFVGELLPRGAPVRSYYEFPVRRAMLRYRVRSIDGNYRGSPDWGESPERKETVERIVRRIDAYATDHGLGPPRAAT